MAVYVHVDGHQNLVKVICLHLRDRIFRQRLWTFRKTDYIMIMIMMIIMMNDKHFWILF